MHHLLNVDDLKPNDIEAIFNIAHYCHTGHGESFRVKNKIMATLFFEPSTRTKLSFQAAMYKLGGQVIDLPTESSQKKGESDADTVKTVAQYADVLVIRHPAEIMESLAAYSDKPVINAGEGHLEHPTQALIDLYTIRQYQSKKEKITIMFTGDCYYSRTIPSLLSLLRREPDKYRIIFTNEVAPWIEKEANMIFTDESKIKDNLPKVDVLYMTRTQKERWGKTPEKGTESDFVLTKDLTYTMKADAIIMHPLPRNEEIHPEVDQNYRAVYFQQVKNGLFVRMGLLYHLL